MERVTGRLKQRLRTRHILRLQKGGCTMDAGFVRLDLLTSPERRADHCSSITGCVMDAGGLNLHQSPRELRDGSEKFQERYREYILR